MNVRRWNGFVWLVLLTSGLLVSGCRRTYVIVARPAGGYRVDTLRATLNGNTARVIFRFDTVTHTRNIYITDTLWREGTRVIRDTVFRYRRDTIRIVRRDTLRIIRRDTLRLYRVDTVHSVTGSGRVDTVRYAVRDTVIVERVRMSESVAPRVDTVRVVVRDSIVVSRPVLQIDTVRISRTDTVRVTVTRVDTIRLAGARKLFVPPGQYPPSGQCRVWIHDRPPGQQADPAPCDALGNIPAGAFILFGGDAWDFDYDWVADPKNAPPQIVALKRRRP